MIPESHPLQQLFLDLVNQNFSEGVGIRDADLSGYIANMLAEFCETENLFKIRNADGRPLNDVGEMLLESDPVFGRASSFDRERQVRKHIGDYALFLAGMYPESLNHSRLRKARVENPAEFVRTGKESYYIVSTFEHWEYTKVAPLFRRMSQEFEQLVYGLNQIKNDLLEMQHPNARRTDELLV